MSFHLIDPLSSNNLGEINDWNGIGINLLTKHRRHALYHELVHATIEGRVVKLMSIPDPDFAGFTYPQVQKHGLRIRRFEKHRGYYSDYDWLNDAVAEEITLMLSGENDKGAYCLERFAKEQIRTAGVDNQLILNAYCENYDPQKKEGLPHWKSFLDKIREVGGRGFLKEKSARFR